MHTKIKSFEDACKALRIDTSLPDVSMLPKEDQKAVTAHYKLVIIARALNAGWKPDWNNGSQYKYYPWFRLSNGFSFDDVVDCCQRSFVGSRLCFHSEELAEYAGKQFIKLYKDLMVTK